jgi:protein gp37
MSDHSAIQWTDATWNPTTGCTKVSPGCAHCYIERTPAFRIAGNRFERGKTDMSIFHDRLDQPLRWQKPRRVFVNSLSDLFHDDISDQFITDVFGVMFLAHWHTFQVLTKRPERMRAFLARGDHGIVAQMHAMMTGGGISTKPVFGALALKRRDHVPLTWPPPNVWLGVSVENQHFADERIPLLLKTPAAMRFISAEPLLESVNLDNGETSWLTCTPHNQQREGGDCCMTWLEYRDRHFRGIDWVIVGGESGPQSRPFDLEWARSLVAECRRAGVPCFVKQLGANRIMKASDLVGRAPIGKADDPAAWPDDLRVRDFPATPTA